MTVHKSDQNKDKNDNHSQNEKLNEQRHPNNETRGDPNRDVDPAAGMEKTEAEKQKIKEDKENNPTR